MAFQDFTAVNLATAANQKYHQTTISSQNNGLVTDGACVSRFNNQGGIYKLLQGSAEAWDYTSAVTMSLFSPALVATYYFNGEVGRIDYVGGYFSGLATVQNDENTIAYNVPGTRLSSQMSSTGWTSPILRSPSSLATEPTQDLGPPSTAETTIQTFRTFISISFKASLLKGPIK